MDTITLSNDIKICVYAICKNEKKFVERWLNAVDNIGVDYIAILDTGSTDGTYEMLTVEAAKSDKIILKQYNYGNNFRFDRARNDSMKLIPFDTDICVILDFDHIPVEGWTEILREEYRKGNKLVTGYIVDHDENGNELNRWMSKNVHPNSPYYAWSRMIHEGIRYIGSEPETQNEVFRSDFIINHFPDNNKDRSLYLNLLKRAVEEYPTDPYYNIYLGVELDRRYDKLEAHEAFKRGLERCEFTKENVDLHYQMLLNAATTCPDMNRRLDYLEDALDLSIDNDIKTRRLFYYFAESYGLIQDVDTQISYLKKALEVNSYSGDWRDDFELYTGKIEDELALLYYYQKADYLKAIQYGSMALQLDPENERFKNNLNWYFKGFRGEL